MRRVKVITQSQEKSKLDQLCKKYWAFKKKHPLRHARVPEEIKLMTRAVVESGCTISEVAKAMGASGPVVRNWVKATGGEKISSHEQKDQLEEGLVELRAVYRRMKAAALPSKERRQNTLKLGMMVKGLLEKGADVETLAATTGVSHITVRTWLKSVQIKATLDELAEADEMPQDPVTEVKEEKAPEPEESPAPPMAVMPAEEELAAEASVGGATLEMAAEVPTNSSPINQLPPKQESPEAQDNNLQIQAQNPMDDDWIRICIAGQVVEVSWSDLMKKQGTTASAQKARPLSLQPADPSEDFNLLATQDCDMQKLIDRYETLIIKNALARHKTIGQSAEALNVARSTFDAKRRKYGLI